MRFGWRAAWWSCVLVIAACSVRDVRVPEGPHPEALAEPIVVEYPPPPAKVELLGVDPGPPCAWMDGHWQWAGRRWHWTPGAWVVAPPGCYYAEPTLVWYTPPAASVRGKMTSVLYYSAPRWYARGARSSGTTSTSCPAPKPCSRQARPEKPAP